MNVNGTRLISGIVLILITVLSIPDQGQAQAPSSQSEQRPNKPVETERGRMTDGEMKSLKSKVDELQVLIQQQQRMLAELQKQIEAMQNASVVPTGSKDGISAPQQKTTGVPPAQSQAKGQDKPAGVAGWNGGHAFVRSADGSFETQIGGYAQLDFRGYQSGDHPPNSFLVRRARLSLEGKLERFFEFRIEGDFADTTSTMLRDFYVNIHRTDEVQFRFGQFRVPMSQEEMRSDNLQDFVERSMVNNLVPSRSPGLMVSGVLNEGVFEYQVGAFNGKGLLVANNNSTPESAVRLRFAPWKNAELFWAKGLIFGGALTHGRSLGGLSVRGQTESRSFNFFLPDTINGKYNRANGEVTWLLGPAAIRAEYDQTNQRRENLGPGGTNLPGVVAKGYSAQFTYLLTGESKPEAGAVAPHRNLFSNEGGRHGLGAWEVKFRYTNLQISDSTAKSNRAESFYFGPNWYMNRYVRYLLDFGVERFKDPARTPVPGDQTFFVVLSRVQVAF